jgi:hypothetical protein
VDQVLVGRNLSQSLALPTTIIGAISILQMVFPNPIITTHGNRTIDRPLMNSMATGGCKNVDAMHSRGGYQEPIIVIVPILDHKDGHYFRPNKVALKYPDFKKYDNIM